MATYECEKCGMSVNATCGKCDAPLENDMQITALLWTRYDLFCDLAAIANGYSTRSAVSSVQRC
jgi:hypothetical protein